MASSRRILLTTSRNPTPRIRTFCNDLARAISGLVRVNRGKMSTDEIAEKALEYDAECVVIVDRWHGGLDSIRFFQIGESGLISVPPVLHVSGIRLRREFGVVKVKPAVSLVVLASETSVRVLTIAESLSKFFAIPIALVNEAVKIGPTSMAISLDESNRIVMTFMVEPNHVEVGPRIIVSGVKW